MNGWKVVAQFAARALAGGPAEAVMAAAVTAAAEATEAEWSWLVEPAELGTRLLRAGVGWPVEASGFLRLPDESPPAPLAERGLGKWHEAPIGTRGWLGVGSKKSFDESAGEIVRCLSEIVLAALDLRDAAKVSHDYNNQLTTIAVSVDFLLEQTPPEDPRHGDVMEVKTAGERAAELTRTLGRLARR
jgi:hypothetical protein